MISEIIVIVVATAVQLFFSSSLMISHFGINPVRGGSPPVDSKIVDIRGRNIGVLFHISDIELIEVIECVLIIMKSGIVIII